MSRRSLRNLRDDEDLFSLDDFDDLLTGEEVGDLFGDIGRGLTSAAETVGGAIVSAAKWTAGAISTVLDSTPFKIVFPIRMVIDNPIARKLGASIPIVGEALKAEDKAKALLNQIASGKNVTDELMNAGKSAVANANELSAKAQAALLSAPGGDVLRDQLIAQGIPITKAPPVFKGAVDAVSSLGSAWNAAIAKGVAAATGAPAPGSSNGAPDSSANSMPRMALAAPVPMAAPPPVQQVIQVGVSPYPLTPASTKIIQPARFDTTELTTKIEAKFGPQFKAVTDVLEKISQQNQATTEHNQIVDKKEWQRRVVEALRRIATQVS